MELQDSVFQMKLTAPHKQLPSKIRQAHQIDPKGRLMTDPAPAAICCFPAEFAKIQQTCWPVCVGVPPVG